MASKHYDVEPMYEDCLIDPGIIVKVKDEEAFHVSLRVIGKVLVNGKPYVYNDVVTLKFTLENKG